MMLDKKSYIYIYILLSDVLLSNMVLFGLHERTVNIGLPLGADLLLISFYYVSLFALPLSVIHFFYYILLAVYLIKKQSIKTTPEW